MQRSPFFHIEKYISNENLKILQDAKYSQAGAAWNNVWWENLHI
jgi:hypothetical protein